MDKELLREKISETRHNEWQSLAIGIIGLILVLVALFLSFSVSRGIGSRSSELLEGTFATIFLVLGLAIMVLGAVAGIYYSHQRSKLMKLGIDTKETIRDKIGYVCPNCGQRLPEGSKFFCPNCSYEIE